MNSLNDVNDNIIAAIFGIILFIGVLVCCFHPIYKNIFYKIKVTDKTRMLSHNSSHYIIFGIVNGKGKPQPFADKDSFWRWKFNSADIYGQLRRGKTYCIRSNWIRVPFFNWYKNILSIEPMRKCK